MSIAERLASASYGEVEADGITWRLRKIGSREFVAAGGRHLIASLPPPPAGASEYAPEDDPVMAVKVDMQRKLAALDEIDAWVVACVSGAKTDGDWEPLTVVATQDKADAAAHRVWVEDLSIKARKAIAEHAMTLTVGRERADLIASFREGSGPVPADVGAGEAVREVAP